MQNLLTFFKNNKYILLFLLAVVLFFYPFFLNGEIPIPADTIVGMYHPWRDVVWNGLTSGVPFKNFLITDPVRQQYVWRKLAIDQLANGQLPLWNPYSFSGTPLLANFQTAPFYPLNLLFLILPFNLAWGLLVFLQPFLGGIFLYLYLTHMKVSKVGGFIGALAFSFSGFSIAWLEWNTIGHVSLWLPLLLLSVEKVIFYLNTANNLELKIKNGKLQRKVAWQQRCFTQFKIKNLLFWWVVFVFGLISSFFAGHLQIFFYSLLVTTVYIGARILLLKKNRGKTILFFVLCSLFFVLITSIQWLPTLQFIQLSARDFDQSSWQNPGWFIPWQHLIQFIAPDFFGNPATLNYWGVWNYGEMVGYIGVIPIVFVLYSFLFHIDKKILFFGSLVFLSLIFALPTYFSKLPYILNIPFISTSQPTRLLFICIFALSILAALGFDKILADKSLRRLTAVLSFLGLILFTTWLVVLFPQLAGLSYLGENLKISLRNLILPTAIFTLSATLLIIFSIVRNRTARLLIINCILLILIFDLYRFGYKFTPFVKSDWIFPETELIRILNEKKENYRTMSLDRRIMPPNFAAFYRLQDVAGYDPLYLKLYSQLVSAWERKEPDISLASFGRIITPHNFDNFITDFLGVKYILSFGPVESEKLDFVTSVGDTYLYENKQVFPRVFFVQEVVWVENEQQAINTMFRERERLRELAIVEKPLYLPEGALYKTKSSLGKAEILEYLENKITIKTENEDEGFLVLTDSFYPSWRVKIFSEDISYAHETEILKTNFSLRGIFVPKGRNKIVFYSSLL